MSEVHKSYRESIHGNPPLTDAKLQNEYGINKTACSNIANGKSMNFLNEMNFVRISLFRYPTVPERFRQYLHLMDAQRNQDLKTYGPEGSPFPKSLMEVFEEEALKRAYHIAKYKSLEEIEEELIKKGLLKWILSL